jgi:hypothetical protein
MDTRALASSRLLRPGLGSGYLWYPTRAQHGALPATGCLRPVDARLPALMTGKLGSSVHFTMTDASANVTGEHRTTGAR